MFPKLVIVLFITGVLVALDQRSLAVPFFVVALGVVVAIESIRQVPQQMAWVVERLGKFHSVLEPGLNVIVPFLDRVAYRHSLKETSLDVQEQVCITRDNTQLGVDGIIYYQVTDPKLASYGSSDYVSAVTQLAQTTLRSEIGKMELDKTFESRDEINVAAEALEATVKPFAERRMDRGIREALSGMSMGELENRVGE